MANTALHDPGARSLFEQRIRSLTPETRPRWGKMSVDQMLWHCCQAIASSIGEAPAETLFVPLPKSVVKYMVLNLPWVRSAPTAPGFVAKQQYDFETERARVLGLIERFTSRPLDSGWAKHPAFGDVTGYEYSRLHAKHLDHHLTQFGV